MFDPYNARTSLVRYILPLFVLVVMVVMLQMMLDMRSRASALKAEACEESDFQAAACDARALSQYLEGCTGRRDGG